MSNPDSLDRATDALRHSAAELSPPPDLIAATIASIHEASRAPDVLSIDLKSQTRRKLMFRLMNAAAAIALVAVTVWFVPVRSTHASFKEVQTECGKSKNVQYTKVQKLLKSSPEITMQTTVEGRRMRMDYGAVWSMVFDVDARKGLQIDRMKKKYRPEIVGDQTFKRFPNLVNDLSSLPSADAEKAVPEVLDGKNTLVYRLKRFNFMGANNLKSTTDDGLLTVWADPATKLPVKLEMRIYQEQPKEWSVITLKDFSWNVDLPAGFFDTNAPGGYEELPPFGPDGLEIKKSPKK